jgi:SAM-dependent methyltransferase
MPSVEEVVQREVNSLLKGKGRIKLLEAGCGSATYIKFDAEVYAVGIDISRAQLERNRSLREKILGDLQDYPLPRDEFDVVICWMVLEHLPRPKKAILNMLAAVKPGGLVILGYPNPLSFKGFATKLTPFWFHRLFYRLTHQKTHPFPTHLKMAIRPNRVLRLAESQGFSVEFCQILQVYFPQDVRGPLRGLLRLVNMAFHVCDSVVQLISLGKAQSLLLDSCALILRKPEDKAMAQTLTA